MARRKNQYKNITRVLNYLLEQYGIKNVEVVIRTKPRPVIYLRDKIGRKTSTSIYRDFINEFVRKIVAPLVKYLPPEKIAELIGGVVVTSPGGGKYIYKPGWEKPLPPLAALVRELVSKYGKKGHAVKTMPKWMEILTRLIATQGRVPSELEILRQITSELYEKLSKVTKIELSQTVKQHLNIGTETSSEYSTSIE